MLLSMFSTQNHPLYQQEFGGLHISKKCFTVVPSISFQASDIHSACFDVQLLSSNNNYATLL